MTNSKQKRVFISYCHKQGEWVWHDLKPVLESSGLEVLLDKDCFKAGLGVVGQMDKHQDQARQSVVVLSEDYLNSPYCRHELDRAIDKDPDFKKGLVVPLFREACAAPARLQGADPILYIDFKNPELDDPWGALLKACSGDLGTSPVHWLRVRNDVGRLLRDGISVNLVVKGRAKWEGLIDYLQQEKLKDLVEVDLASGKTVTRRLLVTEILKACGATQKVPAEPEDLAYLERMLENRAVTRLLFKHFDMVDHRDYHNKYDLLASLRYMISDKRKLVLLIQSRAHFRDFLPSDHPISSITNLQTVELKGDV